jgi:single-stranded DNA-specific DHH superfamily exonuclease
MPSPPAALCIVADYDCDGATACAVGLRGLRLLGAPTSTTWCPTASSTATA